MEKRITRLQLVYRRAASQRSEPRFDLSGLTWEERTELYDLCDRPLTAAETVRSRELWSRVREAS